MKSNITKPSSSLTYGAYDLEYSMAVGNKVFKTVSRSKKTTLLSVLPFVLVDYANAAPDGGVISQENLTFPVVEQKIDKEFPLTPASPKFAQEQENAIKVEINKIIFKGASELPLSALEAKVSNKLGKKHSFSGLQRITADVLSLYQNAGYIMAQVYLPAQKLSNGTLYININEGKINKINIEQNGRLQKTVTQRYTGPLEGQVLNSETLERKIRLLTDLPDTEARFVFAPSDKEGYANINVTTVDSQDSKGYINLDNNGNRFVGGTRLSGQYNLNNTLGYGEQITFNAASSGEGYNYLALGAAVPLNGDGLFLNTRLSATEYELGEQFSALEAEGDNQEVSVELRYPFIRSLHKNINIAAEFKHQAFDDVVGISNFSSGKNLNSVNVKVDGSYVNKKGNTTRWNVAVSVGNVNLDSDGVSNDTYGTNGRFTKVDAGAVYRHRLSNRWSMSVKAQGQLAGENLDSSVKMQLGGSNAVRAYPSGEASVDNGVIANLEFNYQPNERVTLTGFYDVAVGQEHKHELATDTNNTRRLSGVGVKAAWLVKNNLQLSTILAVRTDSVPVSDDRDLKPRYWLQLTHYF